MSAADTLARQDEADDYKALQAVRDEQYLRDCEAVAMEPLPNHPKQLSVSVVLPVVSRGRRVGGAPLVDERGEIDPDEEADGIDQGPESSETERIEREAGVVLDQRLVLFLSQSRNALELGHRFAALLMRTKDFGPREMMTKWMDLTEARLRAARRDLDDVLDGRAK